MKEALLTHSGREEKIELYEQIFLEVTSLQSNNLDSSFIQKMSQFAVKTGNKELQAKSHMLFVSFYMFNENYQSALNHAGSIPPLIDTIGNPTLHIQSKNLQGRMYHHFGKFDLAISTYLDGIRYSKKYPGNDHAFFLYTNISTSYAQNSQPEEEVKWILKTIKYADKHDRKEDQAYTLYILAWAYMGRSNWPKAIENFKKAIEIVERENLEKYTFFHRGLGIVYSRSGDYDSALAHFSIALKFMRNTGNIRFEQSILNDIAVVYNRKGEYETGLEYGKIAYQVAQKLNEPIALYGSRHTMAVAYRDLKNWREAERLFLVILENSSAIFKNDLSWQQSLFINLSEVYFGQGRYKEAYEFLQKYNLINDSIHSLNIKSKLAESEAKYNSEKVKNENLLLKANGIEKDLEVQKANSRSLLLGLLILFTLSLGAVLWRIYEREKRAKREVQKQKAEVEHQKELIENLQKELHHRMKNNLSFIDLFIALAKEGFPETAYQTKLSELQGRIQSMFEVHTQLFKRDDVTFVSAKEFINRLIIKLTQAYDVSNVKFNNQTGESEKISASLAPFIGLIINEFITNSHKHAFAGIENPEVFIKYFTDDNAIIHLSLEDNGCGMSTDFKLANSSSFGLNAVQLLVQKYNGKFSLDGQDGVKMEVTISNGQII